MGNSSTTIDQRPAPVKSTSTWGKQLLYAGSSGPEVHRISVQGNKVNAKTFDGDSVVLMCALKEGVVFVVAPTEGLSHNCYYQRCADDEPTLVTSVHNNNTPTSIAYNENWQCLVFGTSNGEILYYDVELDSEKLVLKYNAERCRGSVHRHFVLSLLFDASGSLLVSGSADGSTVVWDLQQMRSVQAFKHPGDRSCACLALYNNTLITGHNNGDVFAYNIETGALLRRLPIHKRCVASIVVANERIYVASHRKVEVFHATSWVREAKIKTTHDVTQLLTDGFQVYIGLKEGGVCVLSAVPSHGHVITAAPADVKAMCIVHEPFRPKFVD